MFVWQKFIFVKYSDRNSSVLIASGKNEESFLKIIDFVVIEDV